MNDPTFRQFQITEEKQRLEAGTRRHRVPRPTATQIDTTAEVVLRLCTVHDDDALERLAQLECRTLPYGRYVVALVDGVLVAAQPLVGGPPLADPFQPTAEITRLMRVRAEQLAPGSRTRRLTRPLLAFKH